MLTNIVPASSVKSYKNWERFLSKLLKLCTKALFLIQAKQKTSEVYTGVAAYPTFLTTRTQPVGAHRRSRKTTAQRTLLAMTANSFINGSLYSIAVLICQVSYESTFFRTVTQTLQAVLEVAKEKKTSPVVV